MNKIKILSFIAFILWTLSACVSTAAPTPTNSQLIIPTITPTLEVTKQPSPTPQRFPTPTPRIPQPIPTAIPVIDVNSVEILRSAILTFEKDGNIWVVDHGKFRQLTDSGKDYLPKITFDGKSIFFIRTTWKEHDGSLETCKTLSFADLMIVGVDGSEETVFISAERILPFYREEEASWTGHCGIGIHDFSLMG